MKKLFSGKRNRTIALVLAVALMVTALAVGLGSTLAAKNPVAVTFSQPNTYPALEVGASQTIPSSGVFRALSGDTSIATATIVNAVNNLGDLHVTGVSAGITSASAAARAGYLRNYMFQVTDSRNIVKYSVANGGEVYFSTPNKTAASPVTVETGENTSLANAAAFNRIDWHSIDEDVAQVDPDGTIRAKANGVALIIGEFVDKWGVVRDVHVVVVVGPLNDNLIPGPDEDGDGEPDYWYRRLGRPRNV